MRHFTHIEKNQSWLPQALNAQPVVGRLCDDTFTAINGKSYELFREKDPNCSMVIS